MLFFFFFIYLSPVFTITILHVQQLTADRQTDDDFLHDSQKDLRRKKTKFVWLMMPSGGRYDAQKWHN